MPALRRLLACLVLAVAAGAAAQPAGVPAQADCARPIELASAQRVRSGDGEADHVLTVALPDALARPDRNNAARLAYRLDVSACSDHAAAALWVFRAGAPYSASDDAGRPLALLSTRTLLPLRELVGAAAGPRGQAWNGRIPALFALEPGTRTVTLTLLAPTYLPTGLVRAEVGPARDLLGVQARATERVVAYADTASGVVLVIGLLVGVLWLQRRAGHSLLWLALASTLWGVRGLAYYDHAVVGTPVAFEQFNPLNVLLASAAIVMAVLSLLGLDGRRTRIGLGLATLVSSALLGLSVWTEHGVVLARALAFATAFCMISTALVVVLRAGRRLHPVGAPLVGLGLAGVLACAMHDMLVVTGLRPPDSPSLVFWSFIALLVGFAALTGLFVVRTLRRAEQANRELEAAIAAKASQLEASYALLRDAERGRVQAQAREHLLREMHDGIGAQLMTTLRGLERAALSPEQVRAALQEGLDELRLLMDSGDIGRSLGGALAAWRHRWDPRLDALGLQLQWRLGPELDQVPLDPEAVLQVMRILQEAVANVVKHADATRVSVEVTRTAAASGTRLQLDVTDDGIGLPPERAAAGGGRGLVNMRTRARVLGGALELQACQPHGTRVRLLLPLETAPGVESGTRRQLA